MEVRLARVAVLRARSATVAARLHGRAARPRPFRRYARRPLLRARLRLPGAGAEAAGGHGAARPCAVPRLRRGDRRNLLVRRAHLLREGPGPAAPPAPGPAPTLPAARLRR